MDNTRIQVMIICKIKRMKSKRMGIININVHSKGSFVRKLFNTNLLCETKMFHNLLYKSTCTYNLMLCVS